MSGIGNVGAYAYSPNVVSYTGRSNGEYHGIEDFKPGIYDPEQREKAQKRKKNLITAGVVLLGAAALWFFTKGKGKNLISKLKNFFKGGSAGAKAADAAADTAKGAKAVVINTADATEAAATVAKNDKVANIVKNVETKHVDAKTRKIVSGVIDDVPTAAQQAKYDAEIAYKAPTVAERKAIDANNARNAVEYAEAHRVQNLVSPESAKTLEQVKASMSEANPVLSGVFNNGKAEFVLEKGHIVKIKAPDGRVLTDPKKIAKFEYKYGVDLNALAKGGLSNAAEGVKQAA